MLNVEMISIGVALLGVLVALVNIITQVVKKFTYDKVPTRVIAVVVAVLLTVAIVVALCQIYVIPIEWYYIGAAVVIGFIVAYGAMFGYDNLYKELWSALKKVFDPG